MQEDFIDSTQIAVERAIPYKEFKKNPHTVCLTTSLGGHLAFFEMGGGRWHAKPVCLISNQELLTMRALLTILGVQLLEAHGEEC